jgi:predicted nuclease of predicted toxin-antitoxin system
MRFLLDAQLPKRLASIFVEARHDVIHTSDLPLGNRTPDTELIRIAERDQRVVVTKDRDFEVSHLVRGEPSKLLLVTTGNLTNRELAAVLTESLATITEALTEVGYVELTASSVVIRRDSPTS